MKYLVLLLFTFSAIAGLPPTSSKGSNESTFGTTFKTDYGTIPVTRSGTTVTLGSLPTPMTTAQMNAIVSPAVGRTVYNTDFKAIASYDGTNWVYGFGNLGGGWYGSIEFGSNCSWSTSAVTYNDFPADASCTITTTGQILSPTTNIPAFRLPSGALNGKYLIVATYPAYYDSTSGTPRTYIKAFYDGTEVGVEDMRFLQASASDSSSVGSLTYTLSLDSNLTSAKLYELRGKTNGGANSSINNDGTSATRFDVYYFPNNPINTFATSNNPEITTDTFSAKVSSGGVISDENIDWINGNCTYSSLRMVCPIKSGVSTLPMNCTATPTYSAGWNGYIGVTSTTASEVQIQTIDNNNNNNLSFNLSCQKQGTDYTNAAKPFIVGSFQGYNYTSGTNNVDSFSVSYGTTNATTVCSASPCSYLDQIGNAVSSITRVTSGEYALNTVKTYSKLKCTGTSTQNAGNGGSVITGTNANSMQCLNCNSMPFSTVSSAFSRADSFGTILCQGTY
jgi:hypothetical protein